jgi:hypothetical protein
VIEDVDDDPQTISQLGCFFHSPDKNNTFYFEIAMGNENKREAIIMYPSVPQSDSR